MPKTVSFGQNVQGRNVHVYGAKRPGRNVHVYAANRKDGESSRGESSRGETSRSETARGETSSYLSCDLRQSKLCWYEIRLLSE